MIEFEETEVIPYHNGRTFRPQKDGSQTPLGERPFIAWDGEGAKSGWIVNGNGEVVRQPQPYILLMAALPNGNEYIKAPHLNTTQILKFMIDVEERFPDAFHVAFGFGYDVNQIISSLNRNQVKILHKTGFVYINMRMFRIQWRKGKSLTVTRYYRDGRKTSITIYDAFSFFHTSFVKACEKFIGNHPDLEIVRAGKARRQEFTYADLDGEIIPYCAKEVELTVALMSKFRDLLYGAGFNIRHWHGPGAIASLLLRQQGVHQHMAETPEGVQEAARYAYAAGRFEPFLTGRRQESAWGLDINSAYPEAMTQLPSLANGEWREINGRPSKLAHFGVYRIKSKASIRTLLSKPAGPLFHRDKRHRISFPWITNGWFWTPEAALVWNNPNYEFIEGWEFIPRDNTRPFKWVRDMFNKRRQWQKEGVKAEYALKLGLNSLYGKMAQRVGWNKKTGEPPRWHQLEWAGWVTSYCRAKIYRMMLHLGLETIIAVETDGIYTTRDPSSLGFESANGLGEWKISEYREVVYIQSGLAWLRAKGEDEWDFKYRGLDPNSMEIDRVLRHLGRLGTEIGWDSPESKLQATTSRFVGAGAALASKDYETKFRRWETMPRSVRIGGDGKRIHIAERCGTCKRGIDPSQEMHDLVTCLPDNQMSTPHALPWLGMEEAPWRAEIEVLQELISNV